MDFETLDQLNNKAEVLLGQLKITLFCHTKFLYCNYDTQKGMIENEKLHYYY